MKNESPCQVAMNDMKACGISTIYFQYEISICLSLGIDKPDFSRMRNYKPKLKK